MVRQRLNTSYLLAAVLIASLVAGCATAPPPGRQPPIGDESAEPSEGPSETPAPESEPPDDTAPARPAPDARAPTLALLRQSERSADDGDLSGAIAYVERAIRLNSRDPELWLRLARLQLAADHPATAEQLAHKAVALSGSRSVERRQAWLVVADALEAQGDDEAAERIRAQWRTYRG